MAISETELRSVVDNIWVTQFGLYLERSDADLSELFNGEGTEAMTGAVQISGVWNGAVHVHAARSLVQRVAALMFNTAEDQLDPDDTRDTLGEIANMTAGNVKALIPGECHLSLPIVVEGSDYDLTLIDGELVSETSFTVDHQPLTIHVLKSKQENG